MESDSEASEEVKAVTAFFCFVLHYSYCCSYGLKAQLIAAQGNALGMSVAHLLRPEGAA